MTKLYAAIDGGGTKTESILFDSDGKIIKRLITDSTNINDIGISQTETKLKILFEELLSDYIGLGTEIYSVYAGLSGGGFLKNKLRVREFIYKTLPKVGNVGNDNDVSNVITAGLRNSFGIVLICGTGSATFVKTPTAITQIGGWGYLLGDEGSGYKIGRDGLNAAFKANDGRGQATMLTEFFQKKVGLTLIEMLPDIYAKGKSFIADFSKDVFLGYDLGDEVSTGIINNAAVELVEHLRAGRKYFNSRPIKVILCGGVITNQPKYLELVKDYAGDDFRIDLLDIPPVIGAGINALMNNDNLRLEQIEKLIFNLKNSYFEKGE